MLTIKERLAKDQVVIVACVSRFLHHNMIQAIGVHGGIHAIWFDWEHVGNSIEALEIGTMACRSQGMDCFVRLPATDYGVVTRAYEAGASGVMAAQVRTTAETEQIVRWCKFFPKGNRGLNNGGIDGGFGAIGLAEFTKKSNENNMVIIQIETLDALNEVETIAATDGVDMLFVGPSDLSQYLGVTGDFMHPKCLAALDRISAACKAAKKPWGVVPAGPEYAMMCVEKGCRMVSVTSDSRFVMLGLSKVKENYAKLFGA